MWCFTLVATNGFSQYKNVARRLEIRELASCAITGRWSLVFEKTKKKTHTKRVTLTRVLYFYNI